MTRSAARSLLTIALVLVFAAVAVTPAAAQIPNRDIGGGQGRSKLPRPGTEPPDLQAQKLRKQAEQLRLKASDMRDEADGLRDSNKDDAADNLDQRAEALMERANHLERQAKQTELSSGSHPERVQIPDL